MDTRRRIIAQTATMSENEWSTRTSYPTVCSPAGRHRKRVLSKKDSLRYVDLLAEAEPTYCVHANMHIYMRQHAPASTNVQLLPDLMTLMLLLSPTHPTHKQVPKHRHKGVRPNDLWNGIRYSTRTGLQQRHLGVPRTCQPLHIAKP